MKWRYDTVFPTSEPEEATHVQTIAHALRQAFPTAGWGGVCLLLPGGEPPVLQAFWGDVPEIPATEAPTSHWVDWLLCRAATEQDLHPVVLQGQLRGGVLLAQPDPRPEWAPAVVGALASSLQIAAACIQTRSTGFSEQAELAAELASGAVHGWNNMLQGVAMHAERISRRSPPEGQPGLEAIGRLCEKGRQVGKSLLALALNRPGAVIPLEEISWRIRASLLALKGGRNVRIEVDPLPRGSVQTWPLQTAVLLLITAVADRWGPTWVVQISGSACADATIVLRMEIRRETPSDGPDALVQRIRRAATAAGKIVEQAGGALHWHEAPDDRFVYHILLPQVVATRDGELDEKTPLNCGG